MAVRLRLTRIGGRKNPIWRVVVADQRSKRDGRVIETVGHYNAQTDPSTIVLNEERIRDWLARGAQPSDTVKKLLRTQGIAERPVSVKELLEYLARGLVDDLTRSRSTRCEEDDGTLVLELSVAQDDYGSVIGRGGRTANALRTVLKAAAVGRGRRVFVDIVDAERCERRRELAAGRDAWVGPTDSTAASTSPSPRPALLLVGAEVHRRRGRARGSPAWPDSTPGRSCAWTAAPTGRRAGVARSGTAGGPRAGSSARGGRVVRQRPRGLLRSATVSGGRGGDAPARPALV